MAYALRYYKEIEHADGKVIRLEIHKKDSTAGAIEIGAVVQGLSLQIQGQQGDIDTPIIKTSLSMTFVDAYDIEDGKKNGFWEEFYTPDSVLWKVIVKAKDSQNDEFRTIWGGYVTPDSFMEDLIYRGRVNIIARDNIGHMQDFPFDAEGDADGMISLYNLVSSAWAKIDSPMALDWRGEGDSIWWMTAGDNTIAYDTLMNVSAFKDMNWYQALEKALYSYGVVMRYAGNNRVIVCSLRSMPDYGLDDSLRHIEPIFVSGATRELVPAVKRIEESVEYNLERHLFPKLPLSVFTGETEKYFVTGNSYEARGIAWFINKKTSGEGWCSPAGPMFFNPQAYPFYKDDSDAQYNFLVCNTYEGKGTVGQYRYAEYSRNIASENVLFSIKFGQPYAFNINDELVLGSMLKSVTVAVIIEQSGISQYLQDDGTWGTTAVAHVLPAENTSLMIPASAFNGKLMLKIQIHHIETDAEAKSRAEYIPIYSAEITQGISMLERNTVNTNYQSSNNVVVSRDPEFGPAYNSVALPGFIKNGIFYREGGVIVPAKKWAFGRAGDQQMAVYNHLQLLAYYAKPNNLISGTIVNGDVTRVAFIYDWHGAEHMLISGTYNLLNGHIESAVLREFARYEDMWSDVAGADMPDTEQESRSNMEGSGASGGGASSTYTNTTDVNVSGGGGGTGASYLNDLLDVNTDGVVNQSVLYYNGTSWVDMSLSQLLSPYVKLQSSSQTIKGDITIEGNLVITGDVASGGEGGNTSAEGTVTGVTVSGVDYTSVEAGLLDLTDLMANYALKSASTKVSVSPSLSSGKSIGVISVDGVGTTLYAPATYAWSEISEKPNALLFGGTSSQFLKADGSVDSTSYLSTAGGTLTGASEDFIRIQRTDNDYPLIRFYGASGKLGSLGFGNIDRPIFYSSDDKIRILLHSGNVGEYALKIDGSNARATKLTSSESLDDYKYGFYSYTDANNPTNSYGNNTAVFAFTSNRGIDTWQIAFDGNRIRQNTGPVFGIRGNFAGEGWTSWYRIATINSNVASAQALKHSNGTVVAIVSKAGNLLLNGRISSADDSLNLFEYSAGILHLGYSMRNEYTTRVYGNNIKFHTGDTQRILINSSGNVTIGSSDLAGTDYKLYVTDKAKVSSRLILGDNDNSGFWKGSAFSGSMSGNDIVIWGESKIILYGGYVGIGTTDPKYKLDVAGTGRFTGAVTMESTLEVTRGVSLKGGVEIYGSTPHIDFHFGNATDDYTSRIIEIASGNLAVYANWLPGSNNSRKLGNSDRRWSTIYGVNGDFSNALTVSGTLTANSGATITGDVTINGNLIVSGDVASGGTGQDTPSDGSTSSSGVLTLTGEIPEGSNIPQSSLDAIGLTDQVIADLLIGKYHHVMYTSGITTYCFVVSGQYNSAYKAFTLHWGDDYMDEFMGYVFSLGSSGGWNITIYEI